MKKTMLITVPILRRASFALALLVAAAAAHAQNAPAADSAQNPAAATPAQGAPAESGQNASPDVLVKSVSDQVLDIIRSDKDIRAGNQKKVMDLVQEKILPHFDFLRMTGLAVGPAWRKATPDQRTRLQEQFRILLVRTYSSGLSAYRNQTIDYKPLHANPADNEVLVRSEVKQASAEPVSIDYRMARTPEGWKVYDVAIGGVSLVTTYRDSFGQEVRQNGVDGLIKSLEEKNRQLEEQSQRASR
jgi:phospholipid transport system substrate-binding protein